MTADVKQETPPLNTVHAQPSQEPLELVAAGPDQKNWRGIGIALLVIVIVCGLIVAAIVLLTPGDKNFNSRKSRITLKEVINGRFSYRKFNGTWISDNEFLFLDAYGAVGIYDVKNSSEQILMPNTTLRQYQIVSFTLSPDRQYILLSHNMERLYRYTYLCQFMVYNISSDHLIDPFPPKSPDVLLQYANWGPTGNQLVYVHDNDVYYLPNVTAQPRRLTSNGVEGVLFNGIPDWVYEEEILSRNNAVWFSPDGKKLCFATFNDTDVHVIQYPYYGSYRKITNVYPKILNLRYPKAGTNNPTVTIWVADLESSKDIKALTPPKDYENVDYYFTDVQWVANNAVSVVWLKRSQNSSSISLCQENDAWSCKTNLHVDSNGHGWVDLAKAVFSTDGKSYFVRLPGPPEGNAGRFRHVAAVDTKFGSKTFLTSGKYDIVNILGHDSKTNTLYYISTLEGKPGERHIFSVTDSLNASHSKNSNCLTCDIGPDCLFNDASFSSAFTYYVLSCLGPGIPRIELRYTKTNKIGIVLETNDELRELVDKRAMPKIKNLRVPLIGGYHANVRLYLPPALEEYEITKYPMFVEVYGGPSSQLVSEKFGVNWGSYLASKKNIIYANIDGRGSGYQGEKFLHELYLKLGTVEVLDQIAVTSYLRDTLPYIDEKNIAIFGWSYGGFVSALAVSHDENVFSCGISVAPVTNWLYYDSVYTERFMRMPTPEDNLENYEKADVMKKAHHFKGKKYLLVHGTADDNVHWQQSMMLAKSLTDAGVLFRMQVYPDENHSLGPVKLHLYQTMDDFLDHCFSDSSKEDIHSTKQEKDR